MTTPSIQTLITQAQQVLNLKSTNEIRATLAAVLANANVGTPLNPSLTTQQLWDEFYEIVRQPSDDIMSIITDQMMRMVFSPPAPGGAAADKQVIFNDMGVLAGDAGLTYNKATDALTVAGDLTVDTNTLKVDSTNNRVGIGTATPANTFQVIATTGIAADFAGTGAAGFQTIARIRTASANSNGFLIQGNNTTDETFLNNFYNGALLFGTNNVERYRIDNTGISTWSVAGTTAMTLNSTGLGVGVVPYLGLNVLKPSDATFINLPINAVFADSTAMAAGVGGGIAFSGRSDGTSSTTAYAIISGVKENGTAANLAGALVFGTRDAGGNVNIERLRINSTGNIVMKTAGTGIDFSATSNPGGMTSELLNDYEEGTWTPTVGGTWVVAPTSLTGIYTKVGRIVTIQVTFIGPASKATSTTGWIDGLPFNVIRGGVGSLTDSNVANKGNCLASNTTRIWLTDTSFSGGSNEISVTYTV